MVKSNAIVCSRVIIRAVDIYTQHLALHIGWGSLSFEDGGSLLLERL
jgi:hypothetical protein